MHFGVGALTFDLEPGRGLTDALENPNRVDGLFIERAMIKESENLSILGSEAPLNDPSYTDPAALSHLLAEMRSNFKYVILDLPKDTVADYPMLITESDEIILVADLTLASTRDMVRMISYCTSVSPQANIKVVLNKVAGPTLCEVSRKDFETTIERNCDWEIPLDSKLMVQVARSGKVLAQTAKHSKIGKAINSICTSLTNSAQKVEKEAGLLEKLGLVKK